MFAIGEKIGKFIHNKYYFKFKKNQGVRKLDFASYEFDVISWTVNNNARHTIA